MVCFLKAKSCEVQNLLLSVKEDPNAKLYKKNVGKLLLPGCQIKCSCTILGGKERCHSDYVVQLGS